MPKPKKESHERIIKEAAEEFLTYGFENASLRRIAANAGITVSGLYKHFPNKEEMFASLVQPMLDDFLPTERAGRKRCYREERFRGGVSQ